MGNLCRGRGMLPRSINGYDAVGRTFITGRLLWDRVQKWTANVGNRPHQSLPRYEGHHAGLGASSDDPDS